MKVIFKIFRNYLFYVACSLASLGPALAAPAAPDSVWIPADPTPVVVRPFSAARLATYRAEPEFQYSADTRPFTSAWDHFWRQMLRQIWQMLRSSSYQNFWQYVIYGFVIGLTVYVVFKLLRVEFTGLLGKKATAYALPYETHAENIHELDFTTLLDEAVRQKDYRGAIRLYYLHTLKQLTDQSLIHWQPGKTNRSYIREIHVSALRKDFEKITTLFELVWYGGLPVNEARYKTTSQAFATFSQLISRHA